MGAPGVSRIAAAGALWCAIAGAQGIIQTFAGTDWLFSGDGKPAIEAPLGRVDGVALDAAGNLYLTDPGNHMVMKIDAAGILTVVAGNGLSGYSGDGGPARNASLRIPRKLAFDPAGNLLIAEARLRRVTPQGIISTVGDPSVSPGDGLVVDRVGNIYFSDGGRNQARKLSPNGVITTVAGTGQPGYSGDGGPADRAMLNDPRGLALDAAGNLYIVDLANFRVRKVGLDGIITTFAGNGIRGNSGDGGPATSASIFPSTPIAFGPGGDLYLLSGGGVRKVSPLGIISTVATGLGGRGMTVDSTGVVYVADSGNNRVRRLGLDGIITTVAGSGTYRRSPEGTPAASGWLDNVFELAVDRTGELYYAERDAQRVRRVTPDGVLVTAITTPGDTPTGVAFDPENTLHVFGGDGRLYRVTPAGTRTTVATFPSSPSRIAFDGAGNVYVPDRDGHLIRKRSRDGAITVFAGTGEPGFSGDGGPAESARINLPHGVTVDPGSNVVFTDTGNNRVRRITPQGIISTIAEVGGPVGVAAHRDGSLYVTSGNRVHKVAPNGVLSVFAGGVASGFSGDGGPAPDATLRNANALAVDEAGNVYISDNENGRIRVVLVPPPTFQASAASVSLTARAGGAVTPPSPLNVTGSAVGLAFSVGLSTANGADWLRSSLPAAEMPAALEVTADPAGLAAGTYNGTITITAPNAVPPTRTVAVTFTVAPADVGRLTVEPAGITFGFVRGAGAATRRLSVTNPAAALAFTASTSERWLSVTPASGAASAIVPGNLSVTANPAGMAEGTYSGRVTVTNTSTSERAEAVVIMTITASLRSILLSQTGLTFISVVGGGPAPAQSFGVLNAGVGQMGWTASSTTLAGGGWLAVSPASGSTDASSLTVPAVSVAVNPSGLAAGRYYGQAEVRAAGAVNSPQYVSVVLNVLPAGSNPGALVRPSGLIFSANVGTSPGSQDVTVSNLAGSPASFVSNGLTFDGANWFVHAPTNAVVDPQQPVRMVVQSEPAGLGAGVRRGVVTLLFQDGSVRTVNLLLVLVAGGTSRLTGQAACVPTRLLPVFTTLGSEFRVPAGWPLPVEARVVDDCANPLVTGSVMASFSNGDPPLTLVSLRDGRWSGTWQPRNTATDQVTVTLAAENLEPRLQGTARVGGVLQTSEALPVVGSGGVVSAASYAALAPVSPGSLVSIFGTRLSDGERIATTLPLGTQLGAVTAVLGGRPLPLLYARDDQLNAVIPYDLPVNTRHQLLVRRGAVLSLPEPVTIAAAQPAVFTKNASGRGQGVIVDVNGLYVEPGNPARARDAVVIYCSGLGAVDPPVAVGAAAPVSPLSHVVNPVSVTIGGRAAEWFFAGLTPGLSALYQVNVYVPEGVAAGDAVPVVITVAGQSSPPVTMAAR